MATFTDTFERADGPLGANWQVSAPQVTIVGGRVKTTSNGTAICLASLESGPQEASITFPNNVTTDLTAKLYVKASQNLAQFYQAGVQSIGGNIFAYIGKSGISSYNLVQSFVSTALGASITLRLVYSSGQLFLYVNGTLRCQCADADFGANLYTGFYVQNAATGIDSFTTSGAAATTFSVSPSSAQAGGPPIAISLSGTATSWTPGQPGSPAFTCSAGSLSDQIVTSATTARAIYTPPTSAQTVVITDPSTGLTDSIWCSPDVGPGGGEGFGPKLTDKGAALLNRAGTTPPSEGFRVWTNQDVVTESPILMNQNDALRYIVQYIWFMAGGPPPVGAVNHSALLMDWVSGGYVREPFIDTAPSNTSLKQDLAASLSSMSDLAAQLTGAVDLLGGDSPILSHRDLKLAIDGIQGGADLQPVLDALAAIRGDTTTSLYTLLQSLAGIRTIHSYSLQDVLDAIHLLPTSFDGGYTTADRAAEAAGFVAVLAAIAGLAAVEAEDALASSKGLAGILALAVELAGGVASVLAALESLKALLGGGPNEYRPPVWPGEAHVEWGTAITIESNEPLIGEMHGVVVEITGCEGGTRSFGYDGIKCYSHVGALGFCSDRGDMEPFQALGPTKGIYTVKTMASAFACRLFRGRNVRGTIQPWKIRAD